MTEIEMVLFAFILNCNETNIEFFLYLQFFFSFISNNYIQPKAKALEYLIILTLVLKI